MNAKTSFRRGIKGALLLFLLAGLAACEKKGESDLSLASVELLEGSGGGKVLRGTIAAKPGLKVEVSKVTVYLHPYVKGPTGEIMISPGGTMIKWTTPLVDWQAGATESLEAGWPRIKEGEFYGYTIAVYYGAKLQDFRSEPASLVEEFPLPEKVK